MFSIIGADGKEYGPVAAEQVCQWIASGRANGQTLAQAAGQPGWRRLGEFPEFAQALAAAAAVSPPPVVAPAGGGASVPGDALLARECVLSTSSCLKRGWGLVWRRPWLTVLSCAVAFVLQLVVEFIPVAGWIAGTVLVMVLWGGVDWLFLKLARGQPASFKDTFSGFSQAFVPLMLLSVISMTLVSMGILLCLLPGLYLMAIWLMFPALLIMDKRMDFWPAMELSRKMVNKHFGSIAWLMFVTLLITFGGVVLLVVGMFLTLAVSTAAIVYAYEDLFADRPAASLGQGEPALPAA